MFADRLKKKKKKAGFSLRSLTEALGNQVSAQAIGKYERGEMMPSSGTLLALARTLDVSLDYLMGAQVQQLKPEVVYEKRYSWRRIGCCGDTF